MPIASYRVLVAHDNPDNADLAREWLAEAAEAALDVRAADTLSATLEALANPADAIILDLNLPDSRGLETLRRIAEKSRGIPIIVVSALVDEKISADARRDGAEEVFSKDDAASPLFWRSALYVIQRHQARLQHRQLERLLETTPDAILVVSLTGVVRYANQAALSLLDLHRVDLVGEPLGFPVKDGEPIKIGIPRRGDQRLCEMQVAQIDWLGEGALLASLRDITRHREAQRELSQLRLLLNGVTDYALSMLDPHGIVTSWNTGAQRIYGYAPDEIVGRHFSLLFTENDRADQVPREV
jgi:PAS domain-containing protein